MSLKTRKLTAFIIISFFLVVTSSESQAGTYKRAELLAQITGSTYYVDAVKGNDSNIGTQDSPWKTLAKAQLKATSGDGVILNSGDYGSYFESNTTGRNNYILYIANENSTVHFDTISITNSSKVDSFLIFHGITLLPDWVDPCATAQTGCSDPQYASSTQSTYAKTANVVTITNANHVKIIDCILEGQSKHLTGYGVSISGSQDITVDHCNITKVQRGVNMMNSSTGVNVLNNHIHDIGASAIVQGNAGCTGALIEGNHAHNSKYSTLDDYAPRLAGQEYHGSAVALRDGHATIRNNIFHDGFPSSGIMTYLDGSGHYDNIIIENNLLYDITNVYVLRFYLMGDNTVVRNNTLISIYRGGNDGRYTYETAIAVHSLDTDGTPHLTLSNNILIGATFVTEGATLTQYNNIFYSWADGGAINSGWECTPNNGSVVFTCTYADHPTTKVTTLFGCGTECSFNNIYGIEMDYTLAVGSQAINFGNASTQPTDSLGSLGIDGFLVANGLTRTETNHNAGAYEKVVQSLVVPSPSGFTLQN